ncbi:hypothetical protein HMPREF9629_01444 [Peptoanaerobacter stomatis]|uniref:Type III toxin-antitoxin system ToxN/AbiQ family toxin n=2 Tax=Peptoanaerobacter stomatis TaxID=796937 RepID=G9WZ43_9FIRM|nr:hypothetical protein [Peptoanaerobacter stomatis]EHL16188.1 hypothetical protein HMPREF9629_01444 [Peptoanaerobacter stomatis]
MEFRFLTDEFFNDYKDCTEMEKKNNRPYANICLIELDNIYFAIPIRHKISHSYAVFTNKEKTQGLDLSKAVVINDVDRYIDRTKTAYISDEEYKQLSRKKYFIKQKLITYIKKYKKIVNNKHNQRDEIFCKMSCLQYFHKELNI